MSRKVAIGFVEELADRVSTAHELQAQFDALRRALDSEDSRHGYPSRKEFTEDSGLSPRTPQVAPAPDGRSRKTRIVKAFHEDRNRTLFDFRRPPGATFQYGPRLRCRHGRIVLRSDSSPDSMRIFLHVLKELVVAVAFTLGGMLVLALPAVAVSAIHKLQGVQIEAILLYLPLLLAGLLPYLLPLSFLLGVVTTFGRLAQDNEWTAIRMTGRHPIRILAPGLLVGLVLALTTFWMVSEVLPEIRTKQSRYMITALSAAVRELNPGRTDLQFGDFYLTSRRREGKAFVDAHVYVPAFGDEPARNLRADRIDVLVEEPNILLLFRNARAIVGGTEVQNGDMTLRIDLQELHTKKEGRYDNMRYQSSAKIRAELAAGAEGARRQELRYELHYRMSLASVFGVFLLLGAATGLLQTRGNQLRGLAAAAGYALAFYVLHMRLGKQLADKEVLPPEPCAWAAIAIGLVCGLWLAWRAFRR